MPYRARTEEQQDLQASMRAFFAHRWTEAEMRRAAASETGHDTDLWAAMARELGLPGLAIPEALGGGGFTVPDQLVVLEEMGRVLVGGPFFASAAMAAPLLLALDDPETQRELLPGVASGERIATVAIVETPSAWDPEHITVEATGHGPMRNMTGEKLFVLDACLADTLLVVARVPEGLGVLVVDPGSRGVAIAPMSTLDGTRRQGRVTLDGAAGRLVGPGCDATPAVRRMCHLASVALAAEQVGGAVRCLEATVEYVKVREQFGRPVGSFQAVKHQLAELLVSVEAARAALAHATAATSSSDGPALAIAASVAQALCSEVYSAAADAMIHLHGGIGFTWEHPAHLYYRRAVSSEAFLGRPGVHRAKIARHLLTEGSLR